MELRIALLRGINVGGRRKVPMADLRALGADLGGSDVRSYIQSGNLVFGSKGGTAALETALEEAIESRFGFAVPVIVRTADEWRSYVEGNPFPDASREDAGRVMLSLSKAPPAADAVPGLLERVRADERIERVGDALWIHYPAGIARSKLTPALLDRLVGSPVTARNWRTVLAIDELTRR